LLPVRTIFQNLLTQPQAIIKNSLLVARGIKMAAMILILFPIFAKQVKEA
jgi:hypothetical protein